MQQKFKTSSYKLRQHIVLETHLKKKGYGYDLSLFSVSHTNDLV